MPGSKEAGCDQTTLCHNGDGMNMESKVPSLNRLVSVGPNVQIRPRTRLPFVGLVLLLAAVLLVPDKVWTALLIALAGLMSISYVWTHLLAAGVAGSRQLRYGWVAVGDRFQEQFVLTNSSPAPAFWVEVNDHSTVPGYQVAVARSLSSYDRVQWDQAAVCMQRGLYRLGPWKLKTGDPFGLFEAERSYDETEEIIIHPPIVANIPIPLPPGQNEGRSRRARKAWQAQVNSSGVRTYHPYDPLQRIHWPTTARRDQLMVKEFDQDAAGDIWLVVDCDATVHVGEGGDSTMEKAVLLAAALTARSEIELRQVGFAAYGSGPQIVRPGRGRGQQWRILRALALVQADGQTHLGRALDELATVAGRGSAALIITPSASPHWLPKLMTLARHGIEAHVLLLDRSSFGVEERNAGLRQVIEQLGFNCRLVTSDDIGRPEPAGPARGHWDFRVTGTGKAVAIRRPGT